jgi:hypothetical protein
MNERPGDTVNCQVAVSALNKLLRRCGTLAARFHQTRTLGAHLLAFTLLLLAA